MQTLLIKQIRMMWSEGYSDGFQECCFRMKWKCEADYRYETDPLSRLGQEQIFAVTWDGKVFVIQAGTANEDLEILLYGMDPEELLYLFQSMSVEKYK